MSEELQHPLSAPEHYQRFLERYPEIGKMYESLGKEIHLLGPLDEKTRALIKLSISDSSEMETAFRTHIRKARKLNITKKEIEHAVLLFLPTKGFPLTMKALQVVDQEFKNN